MNMSEFEKVIGYEFKNKSLLETALTHSSYAILACLLFVCIG